MHRLPARAAIAERAGSPKTKAGKWMSTSPLSFSASLDLLARLFGRGIYRMSGIVCPARVSRTPCPPPPGFSGRFRIVRFFPDVPYSRRELAGLQHRMFGRVLPGLVRSCRGYQALSGLVRPEQRTAPPCGRVPGLFPHRQFDDVIRSCRTFAQTERHALLVLPELQPAAVGEGFRFAHPFSADGHEQLRVGPVEHVDVDLVAPAGRDAPCARRHGPGLRAVDRLAVLPQPGADSREAFQSRRGSAPSGCGPILSSRFPPRPAAPAR